MSDRKTALFEVHKSLNAKMVPFGGWLMPVSYEGVLAEHAAVRTACGIFDVSHMGEVRVSGPDAANYLNYMTINDISKLEVGQGQYSAILHPDGGMVDDLILYRVGENEFFVCVNASNAEKDFEWFSKHVSNFNVKVTNESNLWSQIAVQGPKTNEAVKKVFKESFESISKLNYMEIVLAKFKGADVLIARTGYTGEFGYEIYAPNAVISDLWTAFMETRGASGIKPTGLGARDTLRLEACYLLYGNDMNDAVSPLEAGIAWATKLTKDKFVGKESLVKQKESGLTRKIFAFKMVEDGIPRHDMEVYCGDQVVGKVTSGSVLPTVGGAGGMCLIDSRACKEGMRIQIDVRGKRKDAELVKRPLYQAKTK